MSKPRRTTSSPSVSVSRTPSSPPEEAKKSVRLKVKMPSSKLREVTTTAEERHHHNIFTDPVIITGPRNSRSKRRIVEVDTDDEDEDDYNSKNAKLVADVEGDEESDADDVDADADADADGDIDMDDINDVVSRPTVTVTPAAAARVRNADAKTGSIGDDYDDDDELSELGSEDEAAPSGAGDEEIEEDEDEEDEEEGEEHEEVRDEEDDLSESEIGTPAETNTFDISKMTKRQRGHLGGDYLQLPMEPQVKKHLTAEEHAMRRAEMARRRKNLSEKRNEEEKMETINKLLKKQAPKRRGKISAAEIAGEATPGIQEPQEQEKHDPTMIRYVSDRNGCRLGVPEEWAGNPAGGMLYGSEGGGMKLVEI